VGGGEFMRSTTFEKPSHGGGTRVEKGGKIREVR